MNKYVVQRNDNPVLIADTVEEAAKAVAHYVTRESRECVENPWFETGRFRVIMVATIPPWN